MLSDVIGLDTILLKSAAFVLIIQNFFDRKHKYTNLITDILPVINLTELDILF